MRLELLVQQQELLLLLRLKRHLELQQVLLCRNIQTTLLRVRCHRHRPSCPDRQLGTVRGIPRRVIHLQQPA